MTRTALVAALIALGCVSPELPSSMEQLSVSELLGPTDTAGYERALEPREFSFPADHGPHPGFRTEWWYYTGNLTDQDGRRFGYQLTFFQTAVVPESAERDSNWGTERVYMAHFSLTDIESEAFHSHERFARGAVGLAGVRSQPFEVWVEDWSASQDSAGTMRLRASEDDVELDLRLAPGRPPILQGDDGLSQKGSQPGNASYYYSLTRMPSEGRLRIGERAFRVSGSSWMDREWSTSVLEEGQVGWDWFALQLEGGRDLMVYQLRRADGSAHPLSSGTLVEADGGSRPLTSADFQLRILEHWVSPSSGASYPSAWRLSLPAEALELTVRPVLADQELRHTFRYWEGAVEALGSDGNGPLAGRGYVELTGYD